MREITWTTRGDGRAVKVIVDLETSKAIDTDGHETTVPCCDLHVTAYVDGQVVGYSEPVTINHPVAVARIGKLAMDQVNYNRVKAVIDELKTSPEWQEMERRSALRDRVDREYQAHVDKMRAAMTE